MRINWRLASRLSVITLAILVVIIITLVQRNTTRAPEEGTKTNPSGLQGTELDRAPAANFQLTDQFGKTVSVEQLKGKPVIITFLFTNCPDVCPLTAEKMHSALEKLGSKAKDIHILAVSTDPKRDTVDAALKFSKAHRMENSWHFLVGKQDELAPIWKNYSIYAQEENQTIQHTLGVYMLDKQGNKRVYLNDQFKPDDIVTNANILMSE